MGFDKFISGLLCLQGYYKDIDGFYLDAEHDVIYIYPTYYEIPDEDLILLKKCGFLQENGDGDEWEITDYDVEETWVYYV